MKGWTKHLNEKNLTYWWLAMAVMLCYGMLYGLFLVSLSMILFVGAMLLSGMMHKCRISLKEYSILWMGLAIIPFLTGLLFSENLTGALKMLQLNLSYLFIPLGFLFMPPPEKKHIFSALQIFILFMVISSFGIWWEYLANFEKITESVGSGKALPTPVDHVRYSIFMAFAIVWTFLLHLEGAPLFTKKIPGIHLVIGIYLFIFIHVLAVRSGIVLSYLGLLLGGGIYLIRQKRWPLLFLLMVIMVVAPLAAYFSLPSFKNKISYSRYDLTMMLKGEGGNYSDAERARSLVIGYDIWKDYWATGIGTGDLFDEITRRYHLKYGENGRPLYPHNQFLKIMAASGIIGVLFYLAGIYFPFIFSKDLKNPFLLTMVTMLSVSFLVEATLERSYSLAFFCFFTGLLLSRKKDDR